MPRKLFDSEGKEIEVPTEEEIKVLNDSATKVAELEKSVKELEEGANPNWKEVRDTKKRLEADIETWKTAAEKAGHKPEKPGITREETEQIADARARAALLNNHRETILQRFGDKKDVVSKMFDKLAAGEELSYEKIEELSTQAARAVGVDRTVSDQSRSVSSRGTSAPDFGDGKAKEDSFADSDSGIVIRSAMGLSPDPKK